MFQFMFMLMVQLLVKFRFFIQELWERKSVQILYECWRRAYHALLAQLFIFYGIRVAHLYSFLCCVFVLFCLRPVSCVLSVSLEFQFLITSLSCGNIWFFFTFVDNDVVVIFVGFVFSFRTILCTLGQII